MISNALPALRSAERRRFPILGRRHSQSFFGTGVLSSSAAVEMSAPHLVWPTPGVAIKQRSRPPTVSHANR